MKHHRLVSRSPRVATTTGTTGTTTGITIGGLTGSTALEIKVNFSVMMVDRVITYVFQKSSLL